MQTVGVRNTQLKAVRFRCKAFAGKVFSVVETDELMISPGTTCAVHVKFRPVDNAAASKDTLVLMVGDGTVTVDVQAVLPQSTLVLPSSLNFSFTATGALTSQSMTIKNGGEVPTTWRASLPLPFTMTPTCGHLEAFASCSVVVEFAPTEAKAYTANAVVMYDGGDTGGVGQTAVGLNGLAQRSHVMVDPDSDVTALTTPGMYSTDFGTIAAGQTAVARTFILRNTARVAASVTLAFDNPSDLSLSAPPFTVSAVNIADSANASTTGYAAGKTANRTTGRAVASTTGSSKLNATATKDGNNTSTGSNNNNNNSNSDNAINSSSSGNNKSNTQAASINVTIPPNGQTKVTVKCNPNDLSNGSTSRCLSVCVAHGNTVSVFCTAATVPPWVSCVFFNLFPVSLECDLLLLTVTF